jgi:hypothetical protein
VSLVEKELLTFPEHLSSPLGFQWGLICSCFLCSVLLIFLFVLFFLLAIVLCALPFTASDYTLVSFGHCIICPSIYGFWLHFFSFGHCIMCPSIYSFWLHFCIFLPFYYLSFHLRLLITLFFLLAIVLCVLPFTASDYTLVSFGHCIICPSIYGFWLHFFFLFDIVLSVLLFTASDYTFGIFKLFFHMQSEDNNSPHISSSQFT